MHRNHLVDYCPKEETLRPTIDEHVPTDRHHDGFYGRIMEQRIQELKNSEQASMQDSLRFPIEPLRTAPVTLFHRNESVTLALTLVLTPLMFYHQKEQKLRIIHSPILYHQPRE